jgi:uncharacterized protein (TIGR03437 family)
MRQALRTATCLFAIGLAPAFGQGILGTGYFNFFGSRPIQVAPGQIVTVFVSGLNTVLSKPLKATSLPLPNSLGGVSVTLKEFIPSATYPVPLLAVQQIPFCAGTTTPQPNCVVTAITLQVPYEILPLLPGSGGNGTLNPELVVSENGNANAAIAVLQPVNDNLHILSTCDTFPFGTSLQTQSCYPVVTHSDGTLVGIDAPAKAGETVVIYTVGLGATSPAVKTGDANPMPPAVVASPVHLQFDFRTNAGPSRPYSNPLVASPFAGPSPAFVGLTPGQVGLYQINVTIPSTIPAVERCETTCAPTVCTMYNTVQSNLTIDIGANASFDGAAICVQPPQ